MKGLIAFIVLVVLPIAFWIESVGLRLRQTGYGWLPFVEGLITAAVFAFVVSGLPGKKAVGSDDQGNFFFGRFYAVFGFLLLAKVIFAIILLREA